MRTTSLTEFCLETLSKNISLTRVPGLDDLAEVKLLTGEDGGGIKVFRGKHIDKVTLVDLHFGDGIRVPHHDNRLSVQAEIFQILPDFTFKMPIWGINSIVMKDGSYYFESVEILTRAEPGQAGSAQAARGGFSRLSLPAA